MLTIHEHELPRKYLIQKWDKDAGRATKSDNRGRLHGVKVECYHPHHT